MALTKSTDQSMSWTDLGEIVRIDQGNRTDMDGFDVGDGRFDLYFRDWLANSTTPWGDPPTITLVSEPRAPLADVLEAAFGGRPRAVAFQKFYDGWYLDRGRGGYSQDLNPNAPYGGDLQVVLNSYWQPLSDDHRRRSACGLLGAPDGIHRSPPTLLYDGKQEPAHVAPVGLGDDPRILDKQFYIFIFYTVSSSIDVRAVRCRFRVSCP